MPKVKKSAVETKKVTYSWSRKELAERVTEEVETLDSLDIMEMSPNELDMRLVSLKEVLSDLADDLTDKL